MRILKGTRHKRSHCRLAGLTLSDIIPAAKLPVKTISIHLGGKPIIGPPKVVKPINETERTAMAYNKLLKTGILPKRNGASFNINKMPQSKAVEKKVLAEINALINNIKNKIPFSQ